MGSGPNTYSMKKIPAAVLTAVKDGALITKDSTTGSIRDFITKNYKHFNAAAIVDAAKAYCKHIDSGGHMLVTMGGAMSTAEIGISLAEMIRRDKVHAISCTGANLEEDFFNLIAHESYMRVPNYRNLTPVQETHLLDRGFNRVTDTCIPEMEAMKKTDEHILRFWHEAEENEERFFPHEYFYKMILDPAVQQLFETDPKNSWLLAAAEHNLPIFVPGWEDSTTANYLVAAKRSGIVSSYEHVKTGLEYMDACVDWYSSISRKHSMGFFQLGGGISGDFPICVVPLIFQDLSDFTCPLWSYFCQISEARTSYGSYSGAPPNEKLTWGKLGIGSSMHVIESDATVVWPLIAAYVLGW